MANFCSECGEKFPTSSTKFCPNCGNQSVNGSEAVRKKAIHAALKSVLENKDEIKITDLYQLGYQFAPHTPVGITEGSYTFEHANKSFVTMHSSGWLETEAKTERQILDLSGSSYSTPFDAREIQIDFTHQNKSLDGFSPIKWEESKFGKTFLSVLDKYDVNYSHLQLGSKIRHVDEQGKVNEDFLKEPVDLISGMWKASNGLPILQLGQVYRSDQTGREKIYWHGEVLVRSRFPAISREPHYSNLVAIPRLLQNILYVSETKFPSSVVTSSRRSSSFDVPHEKVDRIPKPLIQTEKMKRALCVDLHDPNQISTYLAPEITRLGYIVNDDLSEEALIEFLPGIINSLSCVHEILLDGFANNGIVSELKFQNVLGADISNPDGIMPIENGSLVPAALYGHICERSNKSFQKLFDFKNSAVQTGEKSQIEKAIELLIAGSAMLVGEVFVHVTNVWAQTVIDTDWEVEQILLASLKKVAEYPIDYQDVNALSNLALLWKKMNNIEKAEDAIDHALQRVGSGMEAVINQTNSMLFDSLINRDEIDAEIYETYFQIKSELGKTDECKKVAPKAKELAQKIGAESLLATANSYL